MKILDIKPTPDERTNAITGSVKLLETFATSAGNEFIDKLAISSGNKGNIEGTRKHYLQIAFGNAEMTITREQKEKDVLIEIADLPEMARVVHEISSLIVAPETLPQQNLFRTQCGGELFRIATIYAALREGLQSGNEPFLQSFAGTDHKQRELIKKFYLEHIQRDRELVTKSLGDLLNVLGERAGTSTMWAEAENAFTKAIADVTFSGSLLPETRSACIEKIVKLPIILEIENEPRCLHRERSGPGEKAFRALLSSLTDTTILFLYYLYSKRDTPPQEH